MFFSLFFLSNSIHYKSCKKFNGEEYLCTLNKCHYNHETKKCTLFLSNYKHSNEQDSSVKPCFSKYTNAGDAICFSRKKGVQCGFCNTNKICVPGTSKGPLDNLCTPENYTFGKILSNQINFCSSFTSSKDCKGMCHWDNDKKECQQIPIDVLPELNVLLNNAQNSQIEEKQDSSSKVSIRNVLIYGAITFFGVCIIILSVLIYRNLHNKNLIKRSIVNLDELPSVSNH